MQKMSMRLSQATEDFSISFDELFITVFLFAYFLTADTARLMKVMRQTKWNSNKNQ